jgi:hypothetical protein
MINRCIMSIQIYDGKAAGISTVKPLFLYYLHL